MEKEKNSLKESMLKLRSATDYVLPLKKYVMVAIDGRSFSKIIKNKYEKPFDSKFIRIMNEVAKYVCKNVEGCKFAYTQSDEITFVLTDFDTPTTCAFFGNRLTKILSVIPSMASAKFNQLVIADLCDTPCSNSDLKNMVMNLKLVEFDCKAWSVDNINNVYAYFLWRQIDCIRNSKQQAAQTYLPHNKLKGLNADEQIQLLFKEKGVVWERYSNGEKFGRFIYKEKEFFHNSKMKTDYYRSVWKEHDAFSIIGKHGKRKFLELGQIPDIDVVRPEEIVPEEIAEIIKSHAQKDEPITMSTELKHHLMMNSIDLEEFRMDLEKKYGISLDPYVFQNVLRVRGIVEYVKNEIKKGLLA